MFYLFLFLIRNRQQSLLSDEQAKEVEQILNAAPSVGVAVATVVATATSPTSIKNLIEDLPGQSAVAASAANGEQDIQIAAVPAIVEEDEDEEEDDEEDHARADFDANGGDADGDSDDVEAVDIVGYGHASTALNATFVKADSTETETTTTTPSTATTATTRHDDDEPEWLRDVLEVVAHIRLAIEMYNTKIVSP